ncbi:hypothetical protein [Terribacillus saccharophilus]|uniref:hypothetical protein n=1 Tax=Terribacillus saccharophilus TaxID=361277 RepID=UPI002989EB19|nr:hypothetical protein [Terribacillus saccharophilus]MCM3225937.1 hypothetical protein [Terribacillus saccharophilus]
MDELIKAIPSLLGVLVGGLITFFVQNTTVRKQQKWEREKIEWDRQYQEQTLKFETFNKILQLDRTHLVLEYDLHRGPELNRKKYVTHIKPLLFDVFHLLNEEMVSRIDIIEDIFEEWYVMEEPSPGDDEKLTESYKRIIELINLQFKEQRESKLKRNA